MEQLEVFLGQLNSNYPLNIVSPALCISLANSGRRGNAKEFHITLESFVSSLNDIRENIEAFPATYDESAWRSGSDSFFTDNHAKSLCGVQTRPYFETVNKFVSWANELEYTEGTFQLTPASIEKTLREINVHCLQNVLHYPLFDESLFDGLNEDQIVDELANKLTEERLAPRGAQYFGFKYAQYLDSHTNIITNILRKAGVDDSIATEISKGRGVFNRALGDGAIVKWYCQNIFGHPVENHERTDNPERNLEETQNSATYNFTPAQIIYYGVPGCGKSHQVNKKIKSIPDYNKIRTVFHPEYTNADFIGQILPEVCVDTNGHSVVEYKFNPGPFTEIIRRSYLNPDEEFFLVIEEINRGNAAAIFGDMFQLLDRLDANENPEEVSSEHIYGKGWSSYGIDNPDINAYIRNQLVISSERPEHCSKVGGSGEDANPRLYKSVDIESENVTVIWRERNGNDFTPKPNHLHFSANTAIRLPPNLSIYATMNTSDQNVFTLDNAFQRRWDMELIPNTCNWDDDAHKKQAQLPIGETDIRWETFRQAINSEISGGDFFNADDKQLGLFFIEPDGETFNEKKFANKVLKYLWTDVFKRNTDQIFKADNLSKVVEDFTGADAFDKVFVDTFAQTLNNTNDEIKNK